MELKMKFLNNKSRCLEYEKFKCCIVTNIYNLQIIN